MTDWTRDVVCAHRMYIEGIYACLAAQDSEDLAGEIAELIDKVLFDLYRSAFNDGAASVKGKVQPDPQEELTKDLEEIICETEGDRDWDIVITGLKNALAKAREQRS